MKKAKLMLTGIAVLAVVGGALAFKARTDQGSFCILTTQGNAIGDPATSTFVNAEFAGPRTYYYAVKPTNLTCGAVDVTTSGPIEEE